MSEYDALSDFLTAPRVHTAVFIGEAAAALDHMRVTGHGTPEEKAHVEGHLTSATAAWATHRLLVDGVPLERTANVEWVIQDARQWLTEHPAELAAYDQEFAEFRDRAKGT